MSEPQENESSHQEALPNEEVIGKVLSFAEVVRDNIDPMLDEHTNVKTCRTLTVGSAKLLESIGHHPVIKVKVNPYGDVYHYWLEDPELGVSVDYFPVAHFTSLKEAPAGLSNPLIDLISQKTMVLPLDSAQYQEILGAGKIEIRNRGKTSIEQGEQGKLTWDHIHLDKMPNVIKEQLETLI